MNFWQIMQLAGIISGWIAAAGRDGEIDEEEMLELIREIVKASGLKLKVRIPAPPGLEDS